MIQYKYSSKGEPIVPSELREILQALLSSIREQRLRVDQVEYKFVTNRLDSPGTEQWGAAKSKPGNVLENLIRKSCKSPVDGISELAAIFRRLERAPRTPAELRGEVIEASRQFGMLDDEVDAGVDRVVGLLLRKASEPGRRIVRREEIHKALTGCDKPYRLLSAQSVEVRLDEVARCKRDETGGRTTIPRVVSTEIARAVLEHPVTVVVGDGGSGKSVAACDAITIGLQEPSAPPGFGLFVPACRASPEAVMREIARWRNLGYHSDGQEVKRSISRLRAAFPGNPLLVICMDAVDEKAGNARLPEDAQYFIRALICNAIEEHELLGIPSTSIVLTCRRQDELDNLVRGGFGFAAPFHRIAVDDFDDDEIKELARMLDSSVKDRIIGHLQMRGAGAGRMPSGAADPVSTAVLETIRHPVLWQFFSALVVPIQHDCLDGDVRGFEQLAASYRDWFRRKAEVRISGLQKHECTMSLKAAAQRFQGDPARVGEKERDWLSPCVAAGCSKLGAIRIFEEAMTAGILLEVEKHGRRWRWRHTRFCDYLIRSEVNGT